MDIVYGYVSLYIVNRKAILRMIRRIFRRYKWKLFWIIVLLIFFLLINYKHISNVTKDSIFDNVSEISQTEFVLLLGTPKHLPNGAINNYYLNRINATIELYTNNKIKKIIISADTLNKYQENEVELIKNDLIENGINEFDLILDENGNRTWNSILGTKKVVNQKRLIIISQQFHLERALYISNRKTNIDAIGFKAKGEMSYNLWIREILARVKMQMDLIMN